MQQQLIHYFDDELAYIRKGMQQFAKRYPHVAAGLNINSNNMEDPHVTRLLEGFALIMSRMRCYQDEKFNELNAALLDALFPYYRAPIPSLSVIQLQVSSGLKQVSSLARGELVETKPVKGVPLLFTTCYQVELTPLKIESIVFDSKVKLNTKHNQAVSSSLTLKLSCLDPDTALSQLAMKKLRFYITEQELLGENIYQHLMTNCCMIKIANQHFIDVAQILKPVGFAEDEALIPWDNVSAPVNRLLIEYFCFQSKFMFFDLDLSALERVDDTNLEIVFYFDKLVPDSFNYISSTSLALNCTPVINLFDKNIEPVIVDNKHFQYALSVDKRHPQSYEIHSVDCITDISEVGRPEKITRLYGQDSSNYKRCWQIVRRYNTIDSHQMSTCYLSLVQPDDVNKESVLDINAKCFNDNLPAQINLSSSQASLQLVNASLAVDSIMFMLQPTEVYRHNDHLSEHVQLTLQIANNRLALTQPEQAWQYITTILTHCDVTKSKQKQSDSIANAIEAVVPEQTVMRSNNSLLSPFIYGTTMKVKLNAKMFELRSRYLFTEVLKHSFELDNHINSRVEWEFCDAD